VPESTGVIGYGNLSFSSYLKPPLTTVALNPYLLGRLGITMLNEKMDCNPNLSSTVFIEPIITLRQSL
ncbi:MAG TPA: substrate-binding domain-containing protein, partial [Petrotogaceae bacterium]|nr:substrate-binding domain-containing protein [Petrotogaceae bacterium]